MAPIKTHICTFKKFWQNFLTYLKAFQQRVLVVYFLIYEKYKNITSFNSFEEQIISGADGNLLAKFWLKLLHDWFTEPKNECCNFMSEPILHIFHLDLHIFGCISQRGLPYKIPDWLAYIPTIFLHSSRGCKSKVKVLAGLVEMSVLGLQTTPSSLSPHMTFSLCACIPLPLFIGHSPITVLHPSHLI